LAIELFVDMVELTRKLCHLVSDSETLPVEFASSQIWCFPYGYVWPLVTPSHHPILILSARLFLR